MTQPSSQETSWRSPFLGIGLVCASAGLYVLFSTEGSAEFRVGVVAGALLSSALVALLPFLLWRYASAIGRRQSLGAAFNVFVAITLTVWIGLYLFVKPALPDLLSRHREAVPAHLPKLEGLRPQAQEGSTREQSQQAAAVAGGQTWPLNPKGRELLQKMRNDYPTLRDSSDEMVVRAVHQAFYSDLPLSQVAAEFGMVLPE